MDGMWETLQTGGSSVRVRTAGLVPRPERVHLWPSVGEYPVYDAFLYHAMLADRHRNELFRDAVTRQAPGAAVLEIGCGPDLLWSLCAADAGADRVVAVESLPDSVREAEELALERAPGRVRVVAGLSTDVTLTDRADLCVAELVGCIGGSEGMARVIEDARRRLLRPGARVVPHRVRTLAAAVCLADLMPRGPGVPEALVPYVESVFDAVGGFFDLRMCVGGVGHEALRSTVDAVEDLRFNDGDCRQGGPLRLTVKRPGRVDGLLLWLDLQGRADGARLDTLAVRTSWLPVYVPFLWAEPVALGVGDVIDLRVTCDLSADGVHPDYRFAGEVRRTGGQRVDVTAESLYAGPEFRRSPLHAALFAAPEPTGPAAAAAPVAAARPR
ncbi:class I SAM-dependent methyltransferase [Streptomyces sp. G45]|uniref:class I SAM-dependent methyltransferase n=1 Tax=Streptomyces sp. G45 TaxID=3406627 RepID=UPI003C28DE01